MQKNNARNTNYFTKFFTNCCYGERLLVNKNEDECQKMDTTYVYNGMPLIAIHLYNFRFFFSNKSKDGEWEGDSRSKENYVF